MAAVRSATDGRDGPAGTPEAGGFVEIFSKSAGKVLDAEVVSIDHRRNSARVTYMVQGVQCAKTVSLPSLSSPKESDPCLAGPVTHRVRGEPDMEEIDPASCWNWGDKSAGVPPDCIHNLGRVVRMHQCDKGSELVFPGTHHNYAVQTSSTSHKLCIPLQEACEPKGIWLHDGEVQIAVPRNVDAFGSSAFPPGVDDEYLVFTDDGSKQSLPHGYPGAPAAEQPSAPGAPPAGSARDRACRRGFRQLNLQFKRFAASFRLKNGAVATEATIINEIFVGVQCKARLLVSADEAPSHTPETAGDGSDGERADEPALEDRPSRGPITQELYVSSKCVSIDTSAALGMQLEELIKMIQEQLDQAIRQPQNWQVLLVDVANGPRHAPQPHRG